MSRRYYEVEQEFANVGWKVTRWSGGFGWHIATYKEKERADEVADFLTRNMDGEYKGEFDDYSN